MTIGSDVWLSCLSTITSPLVVHGLVSRTGADGIISAAYEITSIIGSSTSVVSNITSIATGLAVARPFIIAWDLEEMTDFPSDYRTSLANKIGVVMTMDATPAGTSRLPSPTSTASLPPHSTSQLSSGAKAGLGVGVAIGVALIVSISTFLILRRRKRRATVGPEQTSIPEMEDQDATNARRRWFFGGRWRNEAETRTVPTQELDSKTVHIVPGPPAELDSSTPRHD
jgi:hypothetical protein